MDSAQVSSDVHGAIGAAYVSLGAATRGLLEAVAEHDRQQAWMAFGATSEEAYLVARLGVQYRTAHAWVRAAHTLSRRPELGDRLAGGSLSLDQLAALVDIATVEDATTPTPLGPFDTPSAEVAPPNSDGGSADPPCSTAGLLDLADHLSPAQLAGEAARRRRRTDDEARDRYRRRDLRLTRLEPGHVRLAGDLYDDQAATVWAAFTDHAGRAPKNPDTDQWEPLPSRYADALTEMCTNYVAGRTQATGRPALIIHTSETVVSGEGEHWAETEQGDPLAPSTTARLSCWAEMLLSFDSLDGNPLYLGRSHRFPTWQLAATVRRRDGGCRFPGCGRTLFTNPHHIRQWDRDGGPTDYDNLCTLCTRHHHTVHEGGWTITGDPCNELTFTSPDGTITLTSYPARPQPPPRTRR